MAAIVKGSVDGYSIVLGSDVEFIANVRAPLLLKYSLLYEWVKRSISSYLEIGKICRICVCCDGDNDQTLI